jgi:hypothetical protein
LMLFWLFISRGTKKFAQSISLATYAETSLKSLGSGLIIALQLP